MTPTQALAELVAAIDEWYALTPGEWPFKAKARLKAATASARAALEEDLEKQARLYSAPKEPTP